MGDAGFVDSESLLTVLSTSIYDDDRLRGSTGR